MTDGRDREREHFFGAAKVIAALTMLSRLLGLVRDMAIWSFGASGRTDAFWTAFAIPNLFRRLFGEGALSAAFVPVFTEVGQSAGWDKARLVLANAAGLLAVILSALLVIAEIGLAAWLILAEPAGHWQLLIQLTMIMLPFMLTVCLLALASAALNCRGHFAYPAFAPILLNVCLIAGAYLAHRFFHGAQGAGLFVLSASVIVAGILQLPGAIWLLRSVHLAAVPSLRPMLPAVRRIAKLALPMMIPLGLPLFSALFDRFYCLLLSHQADTFELFGLTVHRPFTKGVVTWLNVAGRLYQFPLGIMAISLATAIFPLLSRYAERGDVAGLRETTNRAVRLSLFLGLPAGVGMILLAGPIITLIARRGQFTSADVAATAPILRAYCLATWAHFCLHVLLRAFFAQKDAATPLRVSCVLAGVNVVLVAVGVFTPLRAAAIGLASAATAAANVVILLHVLRRRWGRVGLKALLQSLARTAVACAVMGCAVALVRAYTSALTVGLVVLIGVAAGACAFIATAALLRCPELIELWGTIRKPRGKDAL